jgi:hypothetical protein
MKLHSESHVDHSLPQAVKEYLLEKFADMAEFFIATVELPEALGTVSCHLHGPATGEPAVGIGTRTRAVNSLIFIPFRSRVPIKVAIRCAPPLPDLERASRRCKQARWNLTAACNRSGVVRLPQKAELAAGCLHTAELLLRELGEWMDKNPGRLP